MRILVVEDEQTILSVLAKRLTQDGYSVDTATDGATALTHVEMDVYDCIVMDIMLPIKDGLTVLKQMRDNHNSTPVLLLTAKDGIGDKVVGLDAGADDYLVKPFVYDELSARIRALLRRNADQKTTLLQFADLELDTLSRQVTRGTEIIELSAKGFTILEYFLRNPNRVLTRGQIIDHAWNFDYDNDSNVIDVYVGYLRRKIDSKSKTKLLHTVRGVGYVLREEP